MRVNAMFLFHFIPVLVNFWQLRFFDQVIILTYSFLSQYANSGMRELAYF